MKTFEITEEQVNAALSAAKSDEVKTVLNALFRKEEKVKPTLDDYKTIRTYEDACEALGIEPIKFGDSEPFIGELDDNCEDYGCKVANLPGHIIALMKLETISRALWGRNFQPKPDAEGNNVYWYAWFSLWTKKEVEDMKPEKRGALLSATADGGETAVFGFLGAYYCSSYAYAYTGFRLCQETEEKANYFGQQFIEIWADYLKFNFEVGERLNQLAMI